MGGEKWGAKCGGRNVVREMSERRNFQIPLYVRGSRMLSRSLGCFFNKQYSISFWFKIGFKCFTNEGSSV